MQQMMTEETPGKVLGCTAVALFSMALLFSVSLTNANFHSSEVAFPDPFAPGKVISLIDQAAASYSKAVMDFSVPAREAFAIHKEGMQWIMAEASGPMVNILGLQSFASASQPQNVPKVAGAYTNQESFEVFSVDSLYKVLFGGS